MAHDHQPLFNIGASVEVSPDDIGLVGSWYEATIIAVPQAPKTRTSSTCSNKKEKKGMEDVYYLVEYKTLLDDNDVTKLLQERVRADHIRPVPPPTQFGHRFLLNDAVEAFHRDGWWEGVISEVLPASYRVTFPFPPDQIEFTSSLLRVHLDWINGAWVPPVAQVANDLEIELKSLKRKRSSRSRKEVAGDGSNKNRSRQIIQTPPSGISEKASESSDLIKIGSSRKGRKSTIKNKSDTQALKMLSAPFVDYSGRSFKENILGANVSLTESVRDNTETLAQKSKTIEKTAVVELYGYKFMNLNGESEIANEGAPNEPNKNGNELMSVVLEPQILDPPIAIKENGNNLRNPSQETEVVEQAAVGEGNVADGIDLQLPFGQTSAIWKIIESMPVFQAMQQRPHFRSLIDKPAHCHEPKAIKYMLMYRNVVEETSKVQLDEDKESIVGILGTLPKLEKNGFQVKGICDHLTTLLKKKDEYDYIKRQLVEQKEKKTEIDGVIEAFNKEMKEIQDKCEEAMSTKECIESEIARGESDLLALRKNVKESCNGFDVAYGSEIRG